MKRLAIAAVLAFPAAANAHPGHEHFGVTNHSLGEWGIVGALVVACAGAAAYLYHRRNQD